MATGGFLNLIDRRLRWVSVAALFIAERGLALVASGGSSLVAVLGLLIAGPSPAVEHGLWTHGLQ